MPTPWKTSSAKKWRGEITMYFKTLLLCAVALTAIASTNAATDKIVCFFASWARYRQGEGSFVPANISPDLCTHVFYSFLGVNANGSLEFLDTWNDIDLRSVDDVERLKDKNPTVKVLFSIGGWNAGNALLNGIIASSKLRTNLIESCIEFFVKYEYDGLDIDWEYPVNSDKTNFVTLLQEMRTAFDEQGYLISVTVAGTPLSSYDVPAISQVVDLINVMSYDFHTTDTGTTGLNAPLYGNPSVNQSIVSWLESGAKSSQLTLSVPFYGHSYTLSDESQHGIGAAAGIGIGGPYTQSPGTLGYNEICDLYSDWTRVWDDDGQVPYIYDGSNWVSYDDPQSVGLKAKFAADNGLAGVAVWSIDTDDFLGNCDPNGDPLLRAIKDNISAK